MAKPRRRQPSKRAKRRSVTWRGTWGPILAVVLLVAGVAALLYLSTREPAPEAAPTPAAAPSPAAIVHELAAKYGCAPGRVAIERSRRGDEPAWLVTVHAPPAFDTGRFVLDLEAAAHNLGGRLEPLPLVERGGYGLAHLEGRVGGAVWKVVVLGEAPPVRATAVPTRPGVRPRLAIVLDDAGNAFAPVETIARLPETIAVAVLPNAQYSAEVVQALAGTGRELLVHMPMEPLPGEGPGPGPGAVEVGLSAAEIRDRVEKAIAVVDGARGLNNHMGSRATADTQTMRAVMEVVGAHDMYFLDSRTTSDTVAEQTAIELGLPALRRDVFLDVVAEKEAIRRALRASVARARSAGRAVAIGHVHPLTMEVLLAELPDALEEVVLVRPSALLRQP